MSFWLVKSEPEVYGIDRLEREGRTMWEGVRNYTARNFMRDSMKVGDLVLFHHSNAEPPSLVGIARVASTAPSKQTAPAIKNGAIQVTGPAASAAASLNRPASCGPAMPATP